MLWRVVCHCGITSTDVLVIVNLVLCVNVKRPAFGLGPECMAFCQVFIWVRPIEVRSWSWVLSIFIVGTTSRGMIVL